MYNPNYRISAQQALIHPWIINYAPFKPEAPVINEAITNMIDCKIQNKLQEAILSMIVHRTINRDDLDALEYAFICIDQDYDGQISFDEFKNAFEQYFRPVFAQDQGFDDDDE